MQLRHSAPEVRRALDEHDAAPCFGSLDGRCQARDAPADDQNASAGAFGQGRSAEAVHAPLVSVRYFMGRLIMVQNGKKTLHVVAADNTAEGEAIIVTGYRPDRRRWTDDFRRRRDEVPDL